MLHDRVAIGGIVMASPLERAKKAEAECERLRQDNKYLGDRWAGQSATIIDMQIELTRWQKIAKEATAEASYNDDCITDEIPLWKEAKEKIKEDYREQAARELGIATSDHIRDTTKMMLTAEQRAALVSTCQIFQSAIDSESGKPLSEQVMLLVGINSTIGVMLDQSRPAWEITEERQAAIELAQYGFRGFPQDTIDASIAELQEMLEEAK